MFNVVLAIQGCDVGAAKGAATLVTEKVQASEIISFAKRELAAPILRVDGKKLGSHNLTTILYRTGSVHGPQTKPNYASTESSRLTWHLKHSRWNVPPSARTNWPVSDSPHF